MPKRTSIQPAIVELHSEGTSPKAIAEQTGVNYNTVRGQISRYKKRFVRRCVAWGDVHGKMDTELKQAIIRCRPTHLYDGGDSLDSQQASPHENHDVTPDTVMQEIHRVAQDVRDIAEALPEYPKVIEFMAGNHDLWVKRTLFKDKNPELMRDFYVDPLQVLVNLIPGATLKQSIFQYVHPDMDGVNFAETQHLNLVGDVLLSHMNFTAKWPGGAVLKLREWLLRWRRPLGLPELSMLVQFHGHKLALLEEEGGHIILIEPGMAAAPQIEHYKLDYQPRWSPGVTGAVYFEQHEIDGRWVTDRASVELIRPHRAIRFNEN